MISWILKFLSNAAQHLPAGIYIQSFIGQSLKTCWVSSCSITTITAAIFQFLSSGSPFSKVCRSSTNFTRDTRNPAALGWSRSSLSLTKTLLSMMPSMTSSIVIPKNFWKTEAAPGFSSWLPKRMTVVPSDSFCGRPSWQSPFLPSRKFDSVCPRQDWYVHFTKDYKWLISFLIFSWCCWRPQDWGLGSGVDQSAAVATCSRPSLTNPF